MAADPRRWIYGVLDVVAGISYAITIVVVIPNRHLSASLHLMSIPIAALVAGVATMIAGARGWRIAMIAASLWLVSTFLLIVRVVISAAFLAGTYGAFGKAASSFGFVMVALVIEVVALLPIVQVRYLNGRAGRRAYGVAAIK